MCTRVFNNQNEFLSTARNMDWAEQLPTSLFYFDAGEKKLGITEEEFKEWKKDNPNAGPYEPFTWVSEHSSVVAMVGSDKTGWATSDGINSAGLVANVLYDTGFKSGVRPYEMQLSVLRWTQFVLDTFTTAEEVETFFRESPLQLVATKVPGSAKPATLHLSVSDTKSDSLIIEVNEGKYHFYRSSEYNIMTNEPSYKKQLEMKQKLIIDNDHDNKKIAESIPGGPYSPLRFERASFYYHFLNNPESAMESLAQSKGVTASASVPVGFELEGSGPNNAATLWTTIANQQMNALKYYFSNSRVVNIVWFDLSNLGDNLQDVNCASLDLVTCTNCNKPDEEPVFDNKTFEGFINERMSKRKDPFLV